MKQTRFLLIVVLTGLVLGLSTVGKTSHSQPRPTTAIVDGLSGTIRRRTCATCTSSAVARGNELPVANTTLLVAATRPGDTEHWAHLRFASPSSRTIALVQAGTDARDSEYRFPCDLGSGTGVWGLRRGTSTSCSRITVSSAGWRSQRTAPSLAQTSKLNADYRLLATQDPGQLTITPDNRLTLIYVYQTIDSTVVNVLAGAATIRAASGSRIIRAGVRYIDYGDRGDTEPIPQQGYTARPVQIFLTPENWSQPLGPQIVEFQTAVEQTRAASMPAPPPDPGPIYVPSSPTPAPAPTPTPTPSPSRPRSPAPAPTYPQPNPNSPVINPNTDNGTIDYGGYQQPPSSPVVR